MSDAPEYVIGLDWGGTRVKIAAVSRDGAFLAQDVFVSPTQGDIDATVDGLMAKTEAFIATMRRAPRAIGLGLTGPVDPDFGVVLLPGKIKGLEKYPIVPRFRERFRVPVRAQNDGTLAMLAEKTVGAAKDVEWAVTITLGTGVGSGVMLEGRVLNDPRFLFGSQLGHLVLDASDTQSCLVGARGTGEMHCSATALALNVRSGLQRGIPSVLSERYFADAHSVDFRAVIEGVETGDALCLDELRRWTERVGWLLVNAVHAYSPQKIILSGGATLAAKHFLPQLQAHVNGHIFRHPAGAGVPVVVSELQDRAGVLGAAMMMWADATA